MADLPDRSDAPPAIQRALQPLEWLEGLSVTGNLRWHSRERVWAFPLRLTVELPPGPLVPRTTAWWAHLHATYPAERPKLLPAKEDGIEHTHFHQEANLAGLDSHPWRQGAPCLHDRFAGLRHLGDTQEPRTADLRLSWCIQRLGHWLVAAATGQLTMPGDLLELPDFRFGDGPPIAFAEEASNWNTWSEIDAPYGYVKTLQLGWYPALTWVATGFHDASDNILIPAPRWSGAVDRQARKGPVGIWVRSPEVPVVPPWQVPSTWRELVEALEHQGVDFPRILWSLLDPRFRDSGMPRKLRPRHPLLIGFPMAERLGNPPDQMVWIGFELPPLAEGEESRPGFRPGRKGYRLQDERSLLGLRPLPWMRRQSWSERDLTGRGRLSESLRGQRILLIGAGALGSAVGELLIRGGVRSLCVVDHERLEVGNLVRHTLTLNDLEQNKAEALAARLSSLSPHVQILGAPGAFGADLSHAPLPVRDAVDAADLVLDCTANDSVLASLERFEWKRERLFSCVALGLLGRRLYCFLVRSDRFPTKAYSEKVDPWVDKDWQAIDESDLPREGIGCWHPLMPATAVDVWLFAATAVRFLNAGLNEALPSGSSRWAVFEQTEEDGAPSGVARVEHEPT